MRKAAASLAAFLIIAGATSSSARDRDNQSLGAEMSRERAETRINRIKNDRVEKKREQDRAKAQAKPKANQPKP